MNFFPEPVERPAPDDLDESPQPAWISAPTDAIPGVVPVELVLGRSESTVVLLTGMRAFPAGLEMVLGVRVRGSVAGFDLNSELFDGPYSHDMGADWQVGRLKWGFEFADGRRVTNVDPIDWADRHDHAGGHRPEPASLSWEREPPRPVLQGGGGGGGPRDSDRNYWLWPLPPVGRLLVVCQWLARDIAQSTQEISGSAISDAAARARPLWTGPGPEAK